MKRLFYCLMLPIVALALTACGDDEVPGGQEGTDPNKIVPDPEGTITLAMRYDGETTLEAVIAIDNSQPKQYYLFGRLVYGYIDRRWRIDCPCH